MYLIASRQANRKYIYEAIYATINIYTDKDMNAFIMRYMQNSLYY